MTELNNDIRELSLDDLDIVAGGFLTALGNLANSGSSSGSSSGGAPRKAGSTPDLTGAIYIGCQF